MKFNVNDELIAKKIEEKNQLKINYEKKLGNIKTTRGINFSIDYLKDNNINTVIFSNLLYQNKVKNIVIYYSGEHKVFNAISCELNEDVNASDLEKVNLIEKLKKQYKLSLIIKEINEATEEYRNELLEIDKKYKKLEKERILSAKGLEFKNMLKNR